MADHAIPAVYLTRLFLGLVVGAVLFLATYGMVVWLRWAGRIT
jgi:hypothetical protein